MRTFYCGCLLACMTAMAMDAEAAENLAPNPGFESIKTVDHIVLQNGVEFDGKVVERKGDMVRIQTRAAVVPKKKSEIKSIAPRRVAARWTFYEIKLPVSADLDEKTAHSGRCSLKMTTKGGKGFMHSSVFPVAAGRGYEVSAWVKGKGKATLHILWWSKYAADEIAMCEHHLDSTKTLQAGPEWRRVAAVFQAPKAAAKAYVRLIAEDGDVWFDDVSVAAK